MKDTTQQEKKFYSMDEAAKLADMPHQTFYWNVQQQGIKTHKFKGNRKKYLTAEDTKRLIDLLKNDPSQEKKFYSIQEAMEAVGLPRATFYQHLKTHGIPTHRFQVTGKQRSYVAAADVQRLLAIREDPSLAGEEE
jgi:predicted HTH domain antitoxin